MWVDLGEQVPQADAQVPGAGSSPHFLNKGTEPTSWIWRKIGRLWSGATFPNDIFGVVSLSSQT